MIFSQKGSQTLYQHRLYRNRIAKRRLLWENIFFILEKLNFFVKDYSLSQHCLLPTSKYRLLFPLHSWYHCILSFKILSSFSTLFLVPLHSFVQNIVFIFHFILGTTTFFVQNIVFIFHFILGTTAFFRPKCRLHFSL